MLSTAEENKRIIRRIYEECFSRDQWEAAEEHMAPDYVNHNPFPGAQPGRAGLQAVMASLRRAFPDLRYQIEDMVAEGDTVAVRAVMRGTHRGEFMGRPPSGREAVLPTMAFIRVEDGRVVERWGVQDNALLQRQLDPG